MNEKAKEVFISYSTKDTDVAFALLEILESYGLDCWIAPRNIPKGAQWAEEIDKAIQNAKVFVVIISSHSIESRQVPKEIALAVSACDSIFPFRIDDTGLQGTFRYYLSDYQFTDATSDTKQKMTELAEIICSSLGKPIPEQKTEKEPVSESAPGPAPEAAPGPVPEARPKPAANSAAPVTPPTNSKKPLLIGVIAAAAVIAVILGIVLSGKNKKSDNATEPTASAVQESTTVESMEKDNTETESSSADDTSESAPARNSYASLFGIWKMIAYEDRGAETNVNINDIFILGDGTPYFSLEGGLSGSEESALASYLQMKDSSKYDLTVEPSFEDTFDGSISAKSGVNRPTLDPMDVIIDTALKDENPTDLTYEDCYPEQYYLVHLTGSYQETPVNKSDVDTWIVYKKQYPLISKRILPALAGKWKDNLGNIWEFSQKDEDLAFKMTDTDGNTYPGVEYRHESADKEKVNFFEHIRFTFDSYKTDFYSVLSFDGVKLEMMDQGGNSFVLTKEQ